MFGASALRINRKRNGGRKKGNAKTPHINAAAKAKVEPKIRYTEDGMPVNTLYVRNLPSQVGIFEHFDFIALQLR